MLPYAECVRDIDRLSSVELFVGLDVVWFNYCIIVSVKLMLFYIGAPCEESSSLQITGMATARELKVMIDLVRTAVTVMTERVRIAEERLRKPFMNRTNVYRCEDGRPICYCCLRVGHVAKYCWDRIYSCPHKQPKHSLSPEPSVSGGTSNVDSLGRDVNMLLNELQKITDDLKISRMTPYRAEDIPSLHERATNADTGEHKEMESRTLTPNVIQGRGHCTYAEHRFVGKYPMGNTAQGIIDFRDVT